ncbi:hypothetical protein H9L39_03492 [Fusarium oxysporum f. sp. albedinis]|nr:hypothetical protein H9L39_03492 [Fusarium oxysporum f. sp. albedinis]
MAGTRKEGPHAEVWSLVSAWAGRVWSRSSSRIGDSITLNPGKMPRDERGEAVNKENGLTVNNGTR